MNGYQAWDKGRLRDNGWIRGGVWRDSTSFSRRAFFWAMAWDTLTELGESERVVFSDMMARQVITLSEKIWWLCYVYCWMLEPTSYCPNTNTFYKLPEAQPSDSVLAAYAVNIFASGLSQWHAKNSSLGKWVIRACLLPVPVATREWNFNSLLIHSEYFPKSVRIFRALFELLLNWNPTSLRYRTERRRHRKKSCCEHMIFTCIDAC